MNNTLNLIEQNGQHFVDSRDVLKWSEKDTLI